GIGIGETYMLSRTMVTEVQARRDGDVLGFDQMLAEALTIRAEGAGIGVQVKGTIRRLRNAKAQLAQRRQQKVTPAMESLTSRLADGQTFLTEGGQRSSL